MTQTTSSGNLKINLERVHSSKGFQKNLTLAIQSYQIEQMMLFFKNHYAHRYI